MKLFNVFFKLAAAIAAVGAIAYLVVKYFDAIKAWVEKLCPCCTIELEAEEVAEEVAAEEVPSAEETPAAEEAPAEEAAPVEDNAPVAEESDFEA